MRRMSREGEWVDHMMVVATANAYKRRILIYSQEGVTKVEPEREEGVEVMLGFVKEEHYFGVGWAAKKVERKGVEEAAEEQQEEGGGDEGRARRKEEERGSGRGKEPKRGRDIRLTFDLFHNWVRPNRIRYPH